MSSGDIICATSPATLNNPAISLTQICTHLQPRIRKRRRLMPTQRCRSACRSWLSIRLPKFSGDLPKSTHYHMEERFWATADAAGNRATILDVFSSLDVLYRAWHSIRLLWLDDASVRPRTWTRDTPLRISVIHRTYLPSRLGSIYISPCFR